MSITTENENTGNRSKKKLTFFNEIWLCFYDKTPCTKVVSLYTIRRTSKRRIIP
jgi:hypothetical protein